MEGIAPSVSVATNGDRVADIRPLGHIQTVQVEVEPNASHDGEDGEETSPAESESAQGHASLSSPVPPSTPPPQDLGQPQTSSPISKRDVPELSRLSPPLPTVAEGLHEAGRKAAASGKKYKKSKPLSTKDLIPLHKDVGKSNKQLLEPATPEFKPTADWVCYCNIRNLLNVCCMGIVKVKCQN